MQTDVLEKCQLSGQIERAIHPLHSEIPYILTKTQETPPSFRYETTNPDKSQSILQMTFKDETLFLEQFQIGETERDHGRRLLDLLDLIARTSEIETISANPNGNKRELFESRGYMENLDGTATKKIE